MKRGEQLIAYGKIEIGMKLTEQAVKHAVHLAFWAQRHESATHYAVEEDGLVLYAHGFAVDLNIHELPNPYFPDQAAWFVMNWLRSLVNEQGHVINPKIYSHFAGLDGGEGTYDDNFVLIGGGMSGIICTVRPAVMYYPK